jgi:hypothetical protein
VARARHGVPVGPGGRRRWGTGTTVTGARGRPGAARRRGAREVTRRTAYHHDDPPSRYLPESNPRPAATDRQRSRPGGWPGSHGVTVPSSPGCRARRAGAGPGHGNRSWGPGPSRAGARSRPRRRPRPPALRRRGGPRTAARPGTADDRDGGSLALRVSDNHASVGSSGTGAAAAAPSQPKSTCGPGRTRVLPLNFRNEQPK